MPLQFYDTRKRRKIPFKPLTAGKVKMYTCGPTVYKDATIGNFRTYMFEDLLRRTLQFLGYEVTQVMNITDVDDKTIREAHSLGVPLSDITEPVIKRFFRDIDSLKIEHAEYYPRATDHIPEMIELIKRLLDNGNAYVMDTNVYYSIASFPEYGRLSGMKLDKLERGVRINADEYEKEDFRDFALWKGWTEEDGDVWWESPWGRGRPGWHIECSALSRKFLGEEFDLHTGGVDNIFPHHENEIAQSVAATGKSFARHWMHSAHLMVEGEKMSKSLGNDYTLKSLREKVERKGYYFSVAAFRLALLSTHYRKPLDFSVKDSLRENRLALARLWLLSNAAESATLDGGIRPEIENATENAQTRFRSALEDDLNISAALASLFVLVTEVNRLKSKQGLTKAEGELLLEQWSEFDKVLGVLFWDEEDEELPSEIGAKVRERLRARLERRFDDADRIRDELKGIGYQLDDGKDETIVIWSGGRKIVENKINNS